MGIKVGSGDVSFRLGASTPSKVALGAVEVWTDVVPTAPGIPTGLTVTTSTTAESSVDVSWTAPESDGDSPITGYKVYRSFDASEYVLHATVAGTSTAVTVPYNGGLSVYIRVSAVNSIGEGNESEVASNTLSNSLPPAPDSPALAVSGPKQLTLSWQAPLVTGGTNITSYLISYQTTAGGAEVFTASVDGTVTEYVFDGSSDSVGDTYTATVAAINGTGTGPATSGVSANLADVPGQPSSMGANASMSNAGAISIDWSAPESDGGSAVQQYEIEYDTSVSYDNVTSETLATEPAVHEITELAGGQSYYLRIRAVNNAGAGEWLEFGGNPVAASPTVPGVPNDFAVVDDGNGGYEGAWTEPGSGGDTITAYAIEQSDADFFYPEQVTDSASSSPYTWSGNATFTLFRIRAINGVGAGEWTEWVPLAGP